VKTTATRTDWFWECAAVITRLAPRTDTRTTPERFPPWFSSGSRGSEPLQNHSPWDNWFMAGGCPLGHPRPNQSSMPTRVSSRPEMAGDSLMRKEERVRTEPHGRRADT
jgi:hypothetical protein